MQTSIYVALVHNNNQVRNDYARAKIESMVSIMQSDYKVKKIEVSYQSEILPHGYGMAIMRDFIYQYLAFKWRKYRLLKSRILRNGFSFFRSYLVKYVINRKGAADRWKKNSAIEVMVTDKHIRAWSQFLDSDANYLIVFEDDAVFKDDSNLRINQLPVDLTRNFLNRPCYVDLGGGCSLADLMISSLEKHHDENYRYYKKPVTNTTCAYLISRELITQFNAILTRKPWLRLISIDWMINSLFISIGKDVSSVVCMHADPTIFKHGTFTGEYTSWQANKYNK
jgi:hypothetical protein